MEEGWEGYKPVITSYNSATNTVITDATTSPAGVSCPTVADQSVAKA
ncbi:MAG: hypothetical protein ACTILG_07865 [Sphingobacterium sp.]